MLKATSTAPPPGTTLPDSNVLFATQMESCNDLKSIKKYLSTSSSIYSLAPLKIIVQAVDFLQPLKKIKSLSPTASSTTSSHSPKYEASKTYSPSGVAMVLMTVAPVSLAILFMSALLTLLKPMHPASVMYFEAKSSIPMLVMITLAPA